MFGVLPQAHYVGVTRPPIGSLQFDVKFTRIFTEERDSANATLNASVRSNAHVMSFTTVPTAWLWLQKDGFHFLFFLSKNH